MARGNPPDDAANLGRDDVRMLVLHVLVAGSRHGYAIARAVEHKSNEALRMGEGTLYPVLRGLQHEGLVTSEWETAGSGPARKVYRLTPAGRVEHERRVRAWQRRVHAMDAVLGLSLGGRKGGLSHA